MPEDDGNPDQLQQEIGFLLQEWTRLCTEAAVSVRRISQLCTAIQAECENLIGSCQPDDAKTSGNSQVDKGRDTCPLPPSEDRSNSAVFSAATSARPQAPMRCSDETDRSFPNPKRMIICPTSHSAESPSRSLLEGQKASIREEPGSSEFALPASLDVQEGRSGEHPSNCEAQSLLITDERMPQRRKTIHALPSLVVYSPHGTRRKSDGDSAIAEHLQSFMQLSCVNATADSCPRTPISSQNLSQRPEGPGTLRTHFFTPKFRSCTKMHTPGSLNTSCRKRVIRSIDSDASPDDEPGTPLTSDADLINVFRKMDVDPPKHLIEHELARRNNQRFVSPSLRSEVRENLEAAFIQSYKLIAKGIDQIGYPNSLSETKQHNNGEKRVDSKSKDEMPGAPSHNTEIVENVTVGAFIQTMLDKVVVPLKEVVDDPDAAGAETALDAVEAAMHNACRGTPVELDNKAESQFFGRRIRPGVTELQRNLRRADNCARGEMIGATFPDGGDNRDDVRQLVETVHELLDIYQKGASKLDCFARERLQSSERLHSPERLHLSESQTSE
ncbi:hypothetical protein BIW11_12456 [Tropilaelaps mercedesae]|uniref:Uncharacterized protein n=1 Tax=Tropilaelaps mercedesae TaxID=418985 RepID=A0A1V9X6Y5_9ACAR|nr:hypothetical protein BIW11_12456 [Tropilaelaps mercedesae]